MFSTIVNVYGPIFIPTGVVTLICVSFINVARAFMLVSKLSIVGSDYHDCNYAYNQFTGTLQTVQGHKKMLLDRGGGG